MGIILPSIFLVVSLAFLVKSADVFTNASERIGLYFGLSSFIVGATIVSIGCSLPELTTSLISVLSGETEQLSFTIDNVIGSNIANILLVGSVATIVVGTLRVKEKLISVDLPFFFVSTALFLLFVMDRMFTWQEGVISLILLVIFVIYTINNEASKEADPEDAQEKVKKIGVKECALVVGGAIGVYFSAKYTISNVLVLATMIPGVDSSLITMLVVALGTSLPEMVVSVRAAIKGKHAVALGNVFGSNTFNSLAVTGIPAFFGTLKVSDNAYYLGIPFLIVATLAFIFITHDDKIPKWEGYALIIIYLAFMGKLLGLV
jgi:cation:H+ antiporter